jgi:hypothetical protein
MIVFMEARLFSWLWYALECLAGATVFVSFCFGLACLFDWRTVKMQRPRLVGLLSLWVAVLSFAACLEFGQWARLAVK